MTCTHPEHADENCIIMGISAVVVVLLGLLYRQCPNMVRSGRKLYVSGR